MAGLILAAINPDNTAAGYYWTFLYPMLLFIVIAAVLWYLFGRPHRRVPSQPISAVAGSRQPDPSTARAAAVAGGLSVAAGSGTTESDVEPQGARLAADSDAGNEAAGTAGSGTAESGAGARATGATGTGYTATGDTASADTSADDTAADDTGAPE